MPVIGRSDSDGVDGLVFEQLSDIDEGARLGHALLAHIRKALGEHILIDIAQCRDLDIGLLAKLLDMVPAAPAHAAYGHAQAVGGSEYSPRFSNERYTAERRQSCACLSP